jgi:HK97 family phage prohead protease
MSGLDFEGLDPDAVAVVCRDRIGTHEAGHAAAMILAGIPIERIEVGDYEGAAIVDWSRASLGDDVDPRDLMRAILAGPLSEGRSAPAWPLVADVSEDEDDLLTLARYAGLGAEDYRRLVNEAHALVTDPEFHRLSAKLATALEAMPHLDSKAISLLLDQRQKGATSMATTRTKQTTSTPATTERGEFTALAAGWGVDRQREQIRRGAFARTIEAWQRSGKRIPLAWNHETGAESIIGSIDPASMKETADGLLVSGRLDITDSEKAREAWRSVKSRAASLSFGYIVTQSHERSDGITELTELDLFEITITPTPANPETRVLSTKSVSTDAELRERAKAMGIDPDNYERSHKVERRDGLRVASFEI